MDLECRRMSKRATTQVRALVNNHCVAYFLYHIHYHTSFYFITFDSDLHFFSLSPALSGLLVCSASFPVLSCPILSCPILSYPILSCPVLSCPILSYHIISYPILSYPILSYPILSYPILSCPVLSYPILSITCIS